mmetsp:Transcript_22129/g.40198  ORF Transcript_22129/g.40198 Transcript_22129/m.40198 type:complete len:298 (+) Transcript_22129:166-1059(+)
MSKDTPIIMKSQPFRPFSNFNKDPWRETGVEENEDDCSCSTDAVTVKVSNVHTMEGATDPQTPESLLRAWLDRINSFDRVGILYLMNRLTIEGVLVGDLEGEIRTHLERSGYERNVIDEIDPAVRNAVELVTNGLWQNFIIQEREHGTTAGATASQVTRPQQRSLDQHLVGNEVTAEGKRDAKSDASSLTDSPKTGKPKAATEKSVGDNSAKNALADSTTLWVTGALNSEKASGDTAEQCATMGIRRTVRQNNLRQGQGDASTVANSDGSLSYTQAPNIDVASGNTERTGSTGTEYG